MYSPSEIRTDMDSDFQVNVATFEKLQLTVQSSLNFSEAASMAAKIEIENSNKAIEDATQSDTAFLHKTQQLADLIAQMDTAVKIIKDVLDPVDKTKKIQLLYERKEHIFKAIFPVFEKYELPSNPTSIARIVEKISRYYCHGDHPIFWGGGPISESSRSKSFFSFFRNLGGGKHTFEDPVLADPNETKSIQHLKKVTESALIASGLSLRTAPLPVENPDKDLISGPIF